MKVTIWSSEAIQAIKLWNLRFNSGAVRSILVKNSAFTIILDVKIEKSAKTGVHIFDRSKIWSR